MLEYYNQSLIDGALQEAFIDNFNKWKKKDWKIAHKSFIKALRHILRSQGCYVASNRTAITRNMYDAAQDPDLNWPQDAIAQQITKQDGFIRKSRFYEAQNDGTVTAELPALQ